jgi:hypothetical protein
VHPGSAEWLARQITEAFPWASTPTYLVRDNDGAYGHVFCSRVMAMGIRDRPISPRSPWQNSHQRLVTLPASIIHKRSKDMVSFLRRQIGRRRNKA